jgi:hypothetical protein
LATNRRILDANQNKVKYTPQDKIIA